MTKELKLHLPDSLFNSLQTRAKEQSVSLEALCLSLIQDKESINLGLVEPSLYFYLANGDLRKEIQKVLESHLPEEEKKKRVKGLKNQLSRCIR
jgi:hypothetical protein